MQNTKISIITVCYNSENCIEQTIQSVLAQTYNNIEYIIIDGASSDNTLSQISKYGNSISKIVSEADNGTYDAMNKGIDLADGEWMLFLNSGDTLAEKSVIEKIFDIKINTEVGVVYGDSIAKTTIGNYYCTCNKPFYKSKSFIPGKGICHQSCFIRADIAKKYKYDLTFKISADYKMLFDIYKNGYQLLYMPIAVSVYEVEGGISKKNPILSFKEDAKVVGRHGTFFYYFLLLQFIGKEYFRRYLSLIIKYFFPSTHAYIKRIRIK